MSAARRTSMLDFGEVYDLYLGRVFAFVAYRVGCRADAEDLTQATFERALTHWPSYDRRRASVCTWLLAIAGNLVIDHYRAGGRRAQPAATPPIDEREPSAAPGVGDLGISMELSAALGQLTDRERELVALRFGADLGGREIAEVTGLTLANVHQIQARALRKLRAALAPASEPRGGRSVGALTGGADLDTDHPVG